VQRSSDVVRTETEFSDINGKNFGK